MAKPLKMDFSDIDPRKTLVVVIDLQNDFCHEKSVLKRSRSKNRMCALRVYKFVQQAKKYGVDAAFSQQIFDESKLTKQQKKYYSGLASGKRQSFGAYQGKISIPCVKGSFGAEYFNYSPPAGRLFIKNNFDIWQNKKFARFLEERKIETLIITGVEILCCVLFAVLGAEERGFNIIVPENLVSGVDAGIKEQKQILRIIGSLYAPVVSSGEILEIWDRYYYSHRAY